MPAGLDVVVVSLKGSGPPPPDGASSRLASSSEKTACRANIFALDALHFALFMKKFFHGTTRNVK